MTDDRRYVRVYYNDLQADYPAIYRDHALLGAWVRLLVIAESMWPTPPELPGWAKGRLLRPLVDCGLVVLVPPHHYELRGHTAERSRRQDAARRGGRARWGNDDAGA